MTRSDVARLRLHNQRIAYATIEKASDVVAWLGAVQAQDYLGALKKGELAISPSPFAKLKRAEIRAIADAANRYGKFLDASVVLP